MNTPEACATEISSGEACLCITHAAEASGIPTAKIHYANKRGRIELLPTQEVVRTDECTLRQKGHALIRMGELLNLA